MLERGPEPGSPRLYQLAGCHRCRPATEPAPDPGQDGAAAPRPGAPGRPGRHRRDLRRPEGQGNFVIGYTREQGHPVCIDLEKFVQRSSGIFGATGTGKSFLTRIILAGLIHSQRASVLVFDMHNEYGFDDTASDTGQARYSAEEQVPGARCAWSGWGRAH